MAGSSDQPDDKTLAPFDRHRQITGATQFGETRKNTSKRALGVTHKPLLNDHAVVINNADTMMC